MAKQTLTNQPSLAPTRKMWAVLITGALVSTTRYFIAKYAPALDSFEFYALLENLLSFGVISAAGYFVREFGDETVG